MTTERDHSERQEAFKIHLLKTRMAQEPVASFRGEAAVVRLYRSAGAGLTASIAPIIDGRPSGGRTFVARDEADLLEKAAIYAPDGTTDDLAQCLAAYTSRHATPKVGP